CRTVCHNADATISIVKSCALTLLLIRRRPCPTLFPYTTLFRSIENLFQCGECLETLTVRQHQGIDLEAIKAGEHRVEIQWCHGRSEEHTSELQSRENLVCRLLLGKKNFGMAFDICSERCPASFR